MFSPCIAAINRSGEYRPFINVRVRHPLLFVQRHGKLNYPGLKRPPERPDADPPLLAIKLSKARIKAESGQLPSASWHNA